MFLHSFIIVDQLPLLHLYQLLSPASQNLKLEEVGRQGDILNKIASLNFVSKC